MSTVKNGDKPQIWFSVTHFQIVIDLQYYLKIYVLGLEILMNQLQIACLSIKSQNPG